MALGTTNIGTDLVKRTLGAASYSISALCSDVSINKWSRYKPVAGVWPRVDGSYGLTLGTWVYTKPVTNCRLGDFRGYEPGKTLPPFYSKQSDNTTPATLSPSGAIYQSIFYLRANIADNTTRITPTDLGMQNYYFGIRYKNPANGTWYYKTGLQISSLGNESAALSLIPNVQVSISGGEPVFANAPAPYGVGNVDWELFVSDTACASWTSAQPNSYIYLPSEVIAGDTMVKSGSFTVADWSHIEDTTMRIWNGTDNGVSYHQDTIIYTSLSSWTVSSKPSWISYDVYNGANPADAPYVSGYILRLYPNSMNSGETRTGIGAGNGVEVAGLVIDVEQYGHNPTLDNYDTTGYPGLVTSSETANLIVNSTTCAIQFYVNSGLGSTLTNLYIYLYDLTAAAAVSTQQVKQAKDGQTVTYTITGISPTAITYGHHYSVYITNGA